MFKIKKGDRIRAFYNDEEHFGVYDGEEKIDITDKKGKIDSFKTPRLKLDSGKTILGTDCWWTKDTEELRKKIEEAVNRRNAPKPRPFKNCVSPNSPTHLQS